MISDVRCPARKTPQSAFPILLEESSDEVPATPREAHLLALLEQGLHRCALDVPVDLQGILAYIYPDTILPRNI